MIETIIYTSYLGNFSFLLHGQVKVVESGKGVVVCDFGGHQIFTFLMPTVCSLEIS